MSYLYITDSRLFDGKVVGDPNNVGGSALTNSSVKEVVIPSTYGGKNVVEIALYSFLCTGITSVFIPKTVIRISRCAFQQCTSLTEVIFESGSCLRECGDAVFWKCTALKKIDLPPNLYKVETSYYFFDSVSLDCFSYSGTTDFSSHPQFFTIAPKVIHVSINYPSSTFASQTVTKDGSTCGVSYFTTPKRTKIKCSVCRITFTPHYFMYMFLLISS
jgi:hypothetical protein